jgi:pseudouridine synthase
VNEKRVTTPGTRAIWGLDRIQVDGEDIPGPPEKTYLMLNKPFGYMCTLSDPEGRPLVTDLVKDVPVRVYPVGRLDFDTLGLLLLTNDGDWTHRLTHPRYRVPRTYKVTVAGQITDEAITSLRSGVLLDQKSVCRARVTRIGHSRKQTVLRMTITQGKSRQVRRMLDAVGYDVVHLVRTGFGTLTLGNLKIGEYRHLETEEVTSMKKWVGLV